VLALYEQSGTRIQANLQKSIPLVRGGPDRLRQVSTICSRTRRMRSPGAATRESSVDGAFRRARLASESSDNGLRFSRAIINGAFEPYVTTKPKGTGLGLAIGETHHRRAPGTIRIENRAGREGNRGAAVAYSLPLAA